MGGDGGESDERADGVDPVVVLWVGLWMEGGEHGAEAGRRGGLPSLWPGEGRLRVANGSWVACAAARAIAADLAWLWTA